MAIHLKILLVLGIVVRACLADAPIEGFVVHNPEDQSMSFTSKESITSMDHVLASVSYTDNIKTTGWGELTVEGREGRPDHLQAYAAGFGEGHVTAERIYQHKHNIWHINYGPNDTAPEGLVKWSQEQQDWLRLQAKTGASVEGGLKGVYWYQMSLLLAQFDGLVEGVNQALGERKIDPIDLWMLNGDGDLETLIPLYKNNSNNASLSGTHHDGSNYTPGFLIDGKLMDCSALMKLVKGKHGLDLYTGHATWRNYAAMLRIYKHHKFHFSTGPTTVSFSSSPGFLSSKDDFYITEKGLVTLETTNNIFDESLFKKLTTQSALVWHRVTAANRLATTAKEWVDLFALHNSGTYNNQWMAVDYKILDQWNHWIALGRRPEHHHDLLWILEQIPGRTKSEDVTDVLVKRGFWFSINVPYLKEIFDESGYPSIVKNGSMEDSYYNASRAKMFMRDAPKVTDFEQFKSIMRYNDYNHDPYSLGVPGRAIAARYDLSYPARAFGAIDSKVTSRTMVPHLSCNAVCGPTTQNQPPFSWETAPPASDYLLHLGHPTVFNFSYINIQPTPLPFSL
eukprot:comp17506_c0_seq1/m.17027 comp17506_c0_seq1/g.17027  ORF comp17506_c0_seq1/g.17027 comp17506_c0_seq1/m.17027 type:complete len:566 (-) comp17506_c0_seq1:322-2019(-)